jgi:hypothetical protein
MSLVANQQLSGRIALIAHDHKKADITEWARFSRAVLARHGVVATGTTGERLGRELDLPVTCMCSGPPLLWRGYNRLVPDFSARDALQLSATAGPGLAW